MENKDKIKKPASILRVELEQDLINIINNAALPAFIIEPILRDLYYEAKASTQRQYEADMEAYEQLLKSK